MQTISGTVIHGKALARKIGYPTANISLKNGILEDGTYKINIIIPPSLKRRGLKGASVKLGAGAYRGKENLFEAHVLDFEGDLYGTEIEVTILEKIRENQPISSLEELKELIDSDIKIIRNNTFYGMAFGTFDKFHPGHSYYLSEAKKYCEKLITIISTDLNVQKIKNHIPIDNEKNRKLNVQKSGLSEKVFIGEENNPLRYIKQFKPKVICLGYDQEGFLSELQAYIKESGFQTEIIRIGPYHPEIYKSSKM